MKALITRYIGNPSPREIAQRELEQHQRALLTHQSSAQYHYKLAEYCEETIHRLTKYLKTNGD